MGMTWGPYNTDHISIGLSCEIPILIYGFPSNGELMPAPQQQPGLGCARPKRRRVTHYLSM